MRSTASWMRGAILLVSISLLAAAMPSTVDAQARCRPLCTPVLLLQPGLISEDVTGDASPETDFNLRIVTAVPTAIARTRLVAIVQWPPFRELGGVRANEPTFLYGGVLTALNTRSLALELEALGAYGPSRTSDDLTERRYSHELLVQADAVFKAGELWTDVESRWRQLGVYAMLGHRVTGVEDEDSPWVLLVGVTIPITP